jgi:hypothetical protein
MPHGSPTRRGDGDSIDTGVWAHLVAYKLEGDDLSDNGIQFNGGAMTSSNPEFKADRNAISAKWMAGSTFKNHSCDTE